MSSRPQHPQDPPQQVLLQQHQHQQQQRQAHQPPQLVKQMISAIMDTSLSGFPQAQEQQQQSNVAQLGKRKAAALANLSDARAAEAALYEESKRLGHARFMQHRAIQQQLLLQQLQQQVSVRFPLLPLTQQQQQQPLPQPVPPPARAPAPSLFDPAQLAQTLFPPPVAPPPPPNHRSAGVDRERDTTSCRFWRTLAQVKKEPNLDDFFKRACATPEFAKGWAESGFQAPTFHPNTKLSWERKKKFLDAIEDLPEDSCLGVVFHGTSPQNIDPILKEGLDPTKRRGQGYGPGEYFSKEPSVSVSYCKGGLEMLVFVVVLPSTLPLKEINKDDADLSDSIIFHPAARPRKVLNSGFRMVPPYFVVVENNEHQIPIGTVTFESVDGSVITESQRKANKLKALNKKFQEASQAVKETQLKAEIIQDLIVYKIDLASEKYSKHRKILSETSKREIAWYVHQRIDEDVIFFYFENLPKPMDQQEFFRANIPSVAQTLENEVKARDDLDKAKTEENRIPSPTSGNVSSSSGLANLICHHPHQV